MKNKGKRNTLIKIATAIVGLFILYLGIPFAYGLYTKDGIHNAKYKMDTEDSNFQIISLNPNNYEYEIDFKFTKGKSFKHPIFAAWLEDSVGNYIETLYISKSISGSTFQHAKYNNNKWVSGIIRRPEALPCWSHCRNIRAEDGLYIPLHSAPDLDAVTGATPQSNFIIKTGSSLKNLDKFKIMLELNQSFDWNEQYNKNSFPNDPIYSGPGGVGQPSIIYSVIVDKSVLEESHKFKMNVIGHGHHSGKNGIIYSDLTGITTALSIADNIIVSINNKK